MLEESIPASIKKLLGFEEDYTAFDTDIMMHINSAFMGLHQLGVGDPSIYKVGSVWFMAYYGVGTGGASDGIATTTESAFPLGWVKYSGNPVLTTGAAGSIDSTYAHKPFIVNHEGRHYHYYTAVGSLGRVIALSTLGCQPQ